MSRLQPRMGGSFAPPLTPEKLTDYKELAKGATPRIKDAMTELITMYEKFQETPCSPLAGTLHPSGAALMIPLEKAEVERIWDYVPWADELRGMAEVFEGIPSEGTTKALRNAAFHLLWYGWELCLDREPITTDKLKK